MIVIVDALVALAYAVLAYINFKDGDALMGLLWVLLAVLMVYLAIRARRQQQAHEALMADIDAYRKRNERDGSAS